jgi:hypothetical protein
MLSGANVFGVGEWPMRWVWIGGWVGRRFEGWKFRLGRCIYSYTTSRAKESAGREIRVRSFGWPCEVGICAYTWQSLHVAYRRGDLCSNFIYLRLLGYFDADKLYRSGL